MSTTPSSYLDIRAGVRELFRKVAEIYDLSVDDLTGEVRRPDIAEARAMVAYVACRAYGIGHSAMGRMLQRHHSTVTHAIQRHTTRMQDSPRLREISKQLVSETIEFQYEGDTVKRLV